MRVGLLAFACFDLGDGGLDQPGALGVGEHGQPGLPDFTASWSLWPRAGTCYFAPNICFEAPNICSKAPAGAPGTLGSTFGGGAGSKKRKFKGRLLRPQPSA
jgi:hypothetical protein